MDGIVRLLTSTMPSSECHVHNVINQLRRRINTMHFTTADFDHVTLHEQLAMIKTGWYRLLEKIRFFKLDHYPLVQLIINQY